ncbi:chemotaxis protein CheB [Caproicibacter sp.]|uniref:chemotaxis protein CheB n=1 Tax=Caproicibacter sp. TaxID=2814884 RepID=UPI003988F3BA
MPFRPIKVLIAHDSLIFRSVLSDAMSRDPAFDEIRTVSSFSEAASLLRTYEPDVMIAGAELRGGGAGTLIKELKIPVVAVFPPETDPAEYHRLGAADVILLSKNPEKKSWEAFCSEACVKAKIASAPGKSRVLKTAAAPPKTAASRVIVIGASTGGTDATAEIIKRLPNNLPGIVIVQHMPSGFTKMYAQRLNGLSGISVAEARDGDRVERGSALIAPGGLHLQLKKDAGGYYVKCVQGARVNGHCPSVGVLFDSAAKTAGREAIGVLLTGMGKDGAEGLLHMRQAGAYTIGQDEATCVVYGMPMAAYEIGAVVKQAPLQQIADLIVQHLK